MTLVGKAVNSENLRTFTATIRWSFPATGKPILLVGWSKPREWSGFDECPFHLILSHEGLVMAVTGTRVLGTSQLAAPVGNVYQLFFAQEANRVIVRSAQTEVHFALPAGTDAPAGYFTLRVEGLSEQPREEFLRIQRVEIETSRQHPLPAAWVARAAANVA